MPSKFHEVWIFSVKRKGTWMEALEKFLQKQNATRSLSHKVDQRDEKLGCGGQDIWQKKAGE